MAALQSTETAFFLPIKPPVTGNFSENPTQAGVSAFPLAINAAREPPHQSRETKSVSSCERPLTEPTIRVCSSFAEAEASARPITTHLCVFISKQEIITTP